MKVGVTEGNPRGDRRKSPWETGGTASLARRAGLFALLWWILAEGRLDAWWLGALGIAAATWELRCQGHFPQESCRPASREAVRPEAARRGCADFPGKLWCVPDFPAKLAVEAEKVWWRRRERT
jgi:hypothetical protein